MRSTPRNTRRVGGFTLVEALIALLALSIGLLGIAALQMTGLRANLGASWRSQANYLAYDIIDRIRANRAQARDPNFFYDTALGAPACPGGSTAAIDLCAWKTNLANTLPGGDGTVDVDINNNVTVTIQWNDAKGDLEADDLDPPLVVTTRSRI